MTTLALKPPVPLLPADVLLYAGRSPWSWAISIKTWSPVSHVEVAVDEHYAVTSREGSGVNVYPIALTNLYAILRPTCVVDVDAAMQWFETVRGQPYGYWQALRFFRLGKEDTRKMMCSPCVARWFRHGGCHVFHGQFDASLVSPGMFLSSPVLDFIWTRSPK